MGRAGRGPTCFSGTVGTSRDYGFKEIYYDGVQDLFDISDDVGTKLLPFNDPDLPVVCNDMLIVDGLG